MPKNVALVKVDITGMVGKKHLTRMAGGCLFCQTDLFVYIASLEPNLNLVFETLVLVLYLLPVNVIIIIAVIICVIIIIYTDERIHFLMFLIVL